MFFHCLHKYNLPQKSQSAFSKADIFNELVSELTDVICKCAELEVRKRNKISKKLKRKEKEKKERKNRKRYKC